MHPNSPLLGELKKIAEELVDYIDTFGSNIELMRKLEAITYQINRAEKESKS